MRRASAPFSFFYTSSAAAAVTVGSGPGGTANQTGYDNITFGTDTPVTRIPEPSTRALLALGLMGLAGFPRRGRIGR